MSDQFREDQTDMSRLSLPRSQKMTPVEIGALIFAVVWVLICIVFFFGLGGAEAGTEKNGVGFVVVVASVLVPIAVVWLAVAAARSARVVTEESERLQASMAAMRKVMIEVQEFQALGAPRPEDRTPRLENAAAEPATGPAAPAMFASTRPHGEAQTASETPAAPEPDPAKMRTVSPDAGQAKPSAKPSAKSSAEPAAKPAEKPAAPKPAEADTQPSLALDNPTQDDAQVDIDDLIRAINFPENAEDEAGFEALRRTLVDRKVATLIQAAQDVLTLLSQDGIYMDDLNPDPAPADAWRAFAAGARGEQVAALGAIRDRSSIALSSGRMKSDPIFKDAALHFLRRFDAVLTDVVARTNDEQMARFGTTRTARAFMLLGGVTGTFN